jgi:hypothetical protein
MTDSNQYCQYWPFFVSEEEKQLPEEAAKIEFLENVYADGFEAYRDSGGLDCYGAKSKTRSGVILQRARKNLWEFRLYDLNDTDESVDRKLTAFVTDFRVAGSALRVWLNGQSESNILEKVNEYLVIPPGLKYSYTLNKTASDALSQ